MASFVTGLESTARTVFRPSLVCNFQIRFDEGLTVLGRAEAAEDKAGGSTTPSTIGSKDQPLILERGPDNLSQVLGVVPRSASVELPGYRQAGQFSLEIAFRDLPLDPRVIRAASVAIHLGSVTPQQFADGMTQIVPFGDSRFDDSQIRSSVLETSPDNIVLAGLVDSIETEHGSGGSVLRMEGRDLRGILLDTPISPKTLQNVDLSKTIDLVVANIVNIHPQGVGIPVDVRAAEWPGGVLPSPATLDDTTRVNLDASGRALKAAVKGEAQEVTFWDLITFYCFQVGGVPHFVGSTLRVRPARSLFDTRRRDLSLPTPFVGGAPRNLRPPIFESEQIQFRRITFGRDIENLRFERKLAGVKVPVIRVISYDTSGKTRGTDRLLIYEHPPKDRTGARVTSTGASGETLETSVITIKAPGIRNKDRLKRIAEDVYEEIGRQEFGGSIETKNLSSFGGDNQDPDLLRLRPGDPIEIRVNASGARVTPPPVSPLTDGASRSFEEEVREVTQRVGDENLARVLVATNRGEVAELTRTFRTSTVRFDWDASTGVSIAFDFQNYVEARYDVTPDASGGEFA